MGWHRRDGVPALLGESDVAGPPVAGRLPLIIHPVNSSARGERERRYAEREGPDISATLTSLSWSFSYSMLHVEPSTLAIPTQPRWGWNDGYRSFPG